MRYKEDTKRISDVAFDEFGRVCQHGRIRTNTIFPEFWENLEHAQTVYTRLSFPPTPLIREPGYEATYGYIPYQRPALLCLLLLSSPPILLSYSFGLCPSRSANITRRIIKGGIRSKKGGLKKRAITS